MEKIKVLYIGNYAPWLYQNFKYYNKFGIDFYVLPIEGKNFLEKYKIKYYNAKRIKDIIKIPVLVDFLNYFFSIGNKVIKLEEIIKKEDFDIVHSLEPFSPYTVDVIRLSKKYNYKIVVETWENLPYNWEYFSYLGTPFSLFKIERIYHKKNKRYSLTNCDKILAKSKTVKNALILEGWNKNKIETIYYGVDSKVFNPYSEKEKENLKEKYMRKIEIENNAKRKFFVLSIGRIEYEKGYIDMFWAIKKLIEEYRNKIDIYWLILGSGNLKNKLKELSKTFRIGKYVKFLGFLDYFNLPDYYNLVDVFVLTPNPNIHWLEQYGFVYIEAQMCSLPVISSLTGEIPNIVKNGETGFLVKPRDSFEIYCKIKELIENEDLKKEFRKNARKWALNFDAEKKAKEHAEFYRSILQ
ncbi:glycosyltransferase family 4 protein [Methanocaldococcus indicus]|uniref:glycosyltransferase family 4 protein n=1 Tax=Methanocaldococcus indicus TaxID=213231 RepID=UPI003C6D72D5